MNFIVSASTDIGNVKKSNQDSLRVKVLTVNGEKLVFAILCDGMGGLEKGEVASASVVKAFDRWTTERLPALCQMGITEDVIREEWIRIIGEYNEKIRNYGKRSGIQLGTTAVILLLWKDEYYIANVGDSRVYEIEQKTSVLTRDQTVVAREVELGHLTEEEAELDSRRSILLQCIGVSEVLYPEFFFGEMKKDAVYMLCSDGFRHEVSAEEIHAYFRPDRMLNAQGMQANELALIALNKQRQERDNISVITIRTF
ncbi:MAG: PP2C family protein-serine/threonine phosphatase [Roseburia sp.]